MLFLLQLALFWTRAAGKPLGNTTAVQLAYSKDLLYRTTVNQYNTNINSSMYYCISENAQMQDICTTAEYRKTLCFGLSDELECGNWAVMKKYTQEPYRLIEGLVER